MNEIVFGTSNNISWNAKFQGKTYSFRTGTAGDHEELLAQGRLRENSQRKKQINKLPYFRNLQEARTAIISKSF